jgi:hypothetical protein
MDPVKIGAVLLAILSGASEGLGSKLWDGMVALVRRPFRKDVQSGDTAGGAIAVPGTAELAALQQAPGDPQRAVALAEVLLARSAADPGFRRALEAWWDQAEPIRAGSGDVSNAWEQAVDRLLSYYLDSARAADGHMRALAGAPVSADFGGRGDALAWLDAERPCLVAAVALAASTGRDQAAAELSFSLSLDPPGNSGRSFPVRFLPGEFPEVNPGAGVSPLTFCAA